MVNNLLILLTAVNSLRSNSPHRMSHCNNAVPGADGIPRQSPIQMHWIRHRTVVLTQLNRCQWSHICNMTFFFLVLPTCRRSFAACAPPWRQPPLSDAIYGYVLLCNAHRSTHTANTEPIWIIDIVVVYTSSAAGNNTNTAIIYCCCYQTMRRHVNFFQHQRRTGSNFYCVKCLPRWLRILCWLVFLISITRSNIQFNTHT